MKKKQIEAMQKGKRRKQREWNRTTRNAERVAVILTEKKVQMYYEHFGKLFEIVDAIDDQKADDMSCIRHIREESEYDEYRGLVVIYNYIGGMPVLHPKRYWKPEDAERWVKKHTDKIMSLKGKLIYNYTLRNQEELRLNYSYVNTMDGGAVEDRIQRGIRRIEQMIEKRAEKANKGDW